MENTDKQFFSRAQPGSSLFLSLLSSTSELRGWKLRLNSFLVWLHLGVHAGPRKCRGLVVPPRPCPGNSSVPSTATIPRQGSGQGAAAAISKTSGNTAFCFLFQDLSNSSVVVPEVRSQVEKG